MEKPDQTLTLSPSCPRKSIKRLSWHKILQVESCIFERSHICSSKNQFMGNRGRWCSLPWGSWGTESRLRNMVGETGIEENWFLLCYGAPLSLPMDHPGLLPQRSNSHRPASNWSISYDLWQCAMVHAKEVDVSRPNIKRKDSYSNCLQQVG